MTISKETKELLIIYPAVVILAILSVISLDILISLIILSISVFLFLIASKTKYGLLLKTLSFFIFFHFLFFPFLYVLLLKLDTNSFEIDSVIEQRELSNAQVELQERYKTKELIADEPVVRRLLESNSSYLDSTFQYIDRDNIALIDSFMLHKTAIYEFKGHPSEGSATLSICNMKGKKLSNLIGDSGNSISKKLTIKEFLIKRLTQIENANVKLEDDNKKVEKKDIWSYQRILAYSINIFDTDNLKPKTKLSNVLFFIHKLLVAIFILGIIGTTFYDFLNDKKAI